jgi:hypothetical protein
VAVLVVTKDGLRIFMRAVLAAWPTLTLRLFVNDVVPTEETVLSDMEQATFPGYVPIVINTWTNPYQVEDATNVETDEQPRLFTQSYPANPVQTVYGYMVTSPWPHLLWAERAAVPIAMLTDNQTITVRPSLTLRNQT